jgi:hypothetical protein
MMNITRDVINDLLPAYFSGDASSDTRNLIEHYFRQYPDFHNEVAPASAILRRVGDVELPAGDSKDEKIALTRAKRVLRWQQVLLAFATTFTLNAISLGFSFEITNGTVHIHWLSIPGQGLVIAGILAISVILWIAYIRVTRRVRSEVLR